MYKIQCDKNLMKVLVKFFSSLKIDAEITCFSENKADISILRNADKINVNADCLIINSDDKELMDRIKSSNGRIISCGLSTRSTVTFSSISDNDFVLCTQRSIFSLAKKKIPPFELPFKCIGKAYDEVSILMIITAALLCGAEVSQLNKIYL